MASVKALKTTGVLQQWLLIGESLHLELLNKSFHKHGNGGPIHTYISKNQTLETKPCIVLRMFKLETFFSCIKLKNGRKGAGAASKVVKVWG